jgi:hypothetical protein
MTSVQSELRASQISVAQSYLFCFWRNVALMGAIAAQTHLFDSNSATQFLHDRLIV